MADSRAWTGRGLDEAGGGAVGRIEGVFVDEKTGEPEWLEARMGRFGHHTLVPASDAVAGVSRVWVPYSRDEIRRAPRIVPGRPLTREEEQALVEHYGSGEPAAGRAAELAKREAGETTVRPSA